MEHPTYEQLLAYVEGTNPVHTAKQVEEHLANCPECEAEIAGWRRTIEKLEGYEWPQPQPVGLGLSASGLKWAVAAAAVLMLTIGIGLGRLSEPSAAKVGQQVAAQLKPQLQAELKADLLASLALSEPVAADSFQQQLRRELQSTLTAQQISTDKQQLFQQILAAVEQKQQENRRMLLSLLYQLKQEHEADYLSLRHDLETAASVADNDLQQNRQQLSQLAATLFAKNQQ